MIGIDTNVLVRYLMQDDDVQSPIATKFIESLTADHQGFITLVATVETAWVLSRAYKLSREQITQALEALIRSRELIVDDAANVLCALRKFQDGNADFADCLIGQMASRAGCTETVTFDMSASKSAGMKLLQV